MKTAFYFSVVIFAMTYPKVSFSYPNGPPSSTCFTLYPKHGADQQTGVSPFRLVFDAQTYSPNQTVTVKVEPTTAGRTFKGFQIAVHRVYSSGNDEDFIGTFTVKDSQNTSTIDCKDTPRSMIAHKNGDAKTFVEAIWTAPATNQGNLQFFLTVVDSKSVFWSRVPYPLSAASSTGVVPPAVTVPNITTSPRSPDWTECGKTKGCWMVAKSGGGNNCSGSDCKVALSYRRIPGANPSAYQFEMAVDGADKYIAVGFSDDLLMGDDQTVACTAASGNESVQLGYNFNTPQKYNDKQFTVGVSNLTVGQRDGQAYCSFIRQAILPGNVAKQFNLDNPYYIFLAWGAIAKGTTVIEKHTDAPVVSAAKVTLSAMAVTGYQPKPTGAGTSVHMWAPHSCLHIVLGTVVAVIVGRK